MEKSSKGALPGARGLAAIMTTLAVVLLTVGLIQTHRLNGLDTRMDAVYQKAFFETCELTEAMSINLSKLLVAGDGGQIQLLLNEIGHQTQGALSNLALLPLGESLISATIKFINQAGDFAEGLSVRLASGGALRQQDYENIAVLSENAAAFSTGMAALMQRLERGETALNDSADSVSAGLAPLTNPAGEYPSLLYDGPFSDGAAGGEYRALEGLERVTAEQAGQRLASYLGGVSGIELTGESSVPVELYEFTVSVNGYVLDAAVTRQGGQVLYVLSETDVTEIQQDVGTLLEIADNFLTSRGYGEMEMSYYSRHEGILTVNYAAVQDGVVMYPDLVKLQLSMKDGSIIGVEAGNYLLNHVGRTLTPPVLTPEEALARLGERLTANSVRQAVIPVGLSEVHCYEIHATDGENEYLVYIDAATGAERELMQIISNENGSLVV
ncbi:MAG: germination protein YpeB [Christensenellales bacterium]|nr:germination protein YpeB [Christensenellales bacterium]